MSLLTPGLGLIFWMVIIFAVVLLILSKAGFPVITKMVQKRTDHIEQSLRKAEQAQASLENLAQEQQKLIAQTQAEQAALVKQSAELRDKIIEQAKRDAEVQAAKIVAEAKEQIALEQQNALRELSQQVSLLSVQMAEKILRSKLSQEDERQALSDRYLEELEAKDKSTKPIV